MQVQMLYVLEEKQRNESSLELIQRLSNLYRGAEVTPDRSNTGLLEVQRSCWGEICILCPIVWAGSQVF